MIENTLSRYLYLVLYYVSSNNNVIYIEQDKSNIFAKTSKNILIFWKNKSHMRHDKSKIIIEAFVQANELYKKNELCELDNKFIYPQKIESTEYDLSSNINSELCNICNECSLKRSFFICWVVKKQVYVFCEHNYEFINYIINSN